MRKLWHRFAEPEIQTTLHGWLTIIWFLLAFPICIFLASSIPFLVFISVYAVVAGHWASWQASRTEVMQKQEKKEREAS